MKPFKQDGVIKVSYYSFPVKMHLYPQNSREILFAVILNSICEPGYSRVRDAHEVRNGSRFAPLSKEFTSEEKWCGRSSRT